ncbi:hypothetical protein B5F40_04515 [Gordonibacter sp. An230]|uniref:hypothetical protein n=1 Tax=unclassified Gordonibacter TaxID=2634373 RepID=UPI000B36B848|nr:MULTISPECIES: hypothetical protein [unclassified Gordonibacter]MDN4508827.1 hypothetical protein [Gordonibacter sp. RACS_AR49]OUO91054.1 hypothetical protein B5F40_04515 [Gordonibacter sp. An230]
MFVRTCTLLEWLAIPSGAALCLAPAAVFAAAFWVPILAGRGRRSRPVSAPLGVGAASCGNALLALAATAATPGGFLAKSLLSWAFLSPYLCASVALAASFLVFLATCRRLSYEPYSYSVGRVAASALVFEAAFVPGVPLVVLAMSLL